MLDSEVAEHHVLFGCCRKMSKPVELIFRQVFITIIMALIQSLKRGRCKMMNKPWSKVRQMLEEDFLCESLKGRVRYFTTRYRHAHDGTGRVCILIDDIEKLNMPFQTENEMYAEVYRRKDDSKSLKDWCDEVAGEFHNNGIFEPGDFGVALNEYFENSIEQSLNSDDLLVRLLAILDRRTGKRTLERIKPTINDLPEWLQYFYNLRLENENI